MNRIKKGFGQCCLLLAITIVFTTNIQAEENLNYFQVDGRYDYRTELLRLALSYSDNVPQLVARPDMPVARALRLMQRGEINGIVSLATSSEREENLLAIKIPIMAGILGMRVFLIHRDQQLAFSKITNLIELQSFVAGFGEHWGDLKILQENKLPVEPVAKYSSLFSMLNAKRFDYIPRGINEIFGEYEKHKNSLSNIVVEKHIAIYYPYPVYFFVTNEDEALASLIRTGLKKSLVDGNFKALFLRHHSQLLTALDFNNRLIFNLTNSELPKDVSIENMDWWLKEESRIK